jgi:hypothetical protein
MYYIQRWGDGYLETVDEFQTWALARKMLNEYQISDPSAHYYISTRCCKAWRESNEQKTWKGQPNETAVGN